ncbi:MAG: tRNA epoxyqueuosine(34) reductase QueG [Bacteroidales bacterium]|nr:tRNA epoxyqueuosine(34) reductase QueG [Bacteroidales bacterium]
MSINDFSLVIKNKALELGFNAVGFTEPKIKKNEKIFLYKYLQNNYHGQMQFLSKNTDVRENIKLQYPWVKSIIVCLLSYYPKTTDNSSKYKISYYVYGNDYHIIVKRLLLLLANYIKQEKNNAKVKIFCDTSPIFEKSYAVDAGLGWIGKNTLLINKDLGSFVFIGGLITDVELIYDSNKKLSCPENCNLCIQSCPSKAIKEPYVLDASKCVSYQTIENKTKNYYNNSAYIAGCDICQKVCPFNKEERKHLNIFFNPNKYVFWEDREWQNLNKITFNNIMKYTVFKRVGYNRLKRNIENCNFCNL